MHLDPEALDVAQEGGAAALVELHRHQPRRELHDVGLEPELQERVGGLQAEQAAADDHAAGHVGPVGGGGDGLQVVDGPVDEAPGTVVARHRRDERAGAGGEHQPVVGQHLARGGGDGPCAAVDGLDRVVQEEPDAVGLEEAGLDQVERGGITGLEPGRERNAVVGRRGARPPPR